MVNETAIVPLNSPYRSKSYFRWNSHCKDLLNQSETILLSKVKVPFDTFYIPIGECVGNNDQIWTLAANTDSENTPIVLVHGFAAAIGFWVQNIDELAAHHPVYAIDLLGFGKSSRPEFSYDADEIESQFCESIEKWRQNMQIEKMILLGHSFGGFLATSYAMKYEENIEHLILADPWGFTEKPDLSDRPYWQQSVIKVFGKVPPLGILRAAGPMGEWLIAKMRRDIIQKYENIVDNPRIVATYIHQCNTDTPTGEHAFKRLLHGGPWAKNPIGERMKENFPLHVPVTFLFGAKSWMNNIYGEIIKESRPNSYTHIENIENAGHHVYGDNATDFNRFVLNAGKILKSHKA